MAEQRDIRKRVPARRTHWVRRVVYILGPLALGGALLVGLIFDLGDDADQDTPGSPAGGTRGSFSSEELGISIEIPTGWRQTNVDRGVRLDSVDRNAQLTVLAAAAGDERRQVLRESLAAANDAYAGFERLPTERPGRQRISGRPVLSAGYLGEGPSGTPIRAIVSAVEAGGTTYLAQFFAAASAPTLRVAEAQEALSSLELDGTA